MDIWTLLSWRRIAAIFLGAFALMYALAGITTVSPGEVAFKIKMLGANTGVMATPLLVGTHWVEPFIFDIVTYDTRRRQYPEIDNLQSDTRDGQKINVDVSLEIGLNEKQVPRLVTEIARDWYNEVVLPALRSSIRNTTPYHLSDQIYTAEGKRDIQKVVEKELNDRYGPFGISIAVNLRDVRFMNQDFIAILEKKAQSAQQVTIEERSAEAAAQIAKKMANIAEGNKQKTIKEAEANREQQRLEGEGYRLKKQEEAKGNLAINAAEAEGKRLLREALAGSGGRELVSIEWARNLGPNVKVWGVPTGAPGTSTIMDLNGLVNGAFKGAAVPHAGE